MSPYLVSAPVLDPVDLSALKLHCRVDSSHEDTLITAMRDAAVAHLDGWSGVLGRAIMRQTWAVKATTSGELLLPMPDVVSASADYGEGAVELTVSASASGPVVELDDAGVVTFECEMSEAKLAIAALIIKMLVQHWYANRSGVNIGNIVSEIPMSANDLISTLRWRRV